MRIVKKEEFLIMNLFLFMFIGTHFVNDHDRNVVIGRLGCFKLSIYNTNYFFGFLMGSFVLFCVRWIQVSDTYYTFCWNYLNLQYKSWHWQAFVSIYNNKLMSKWCCLANNYSTHFFISCEGKERQHKFRNRIFLSYCFWRKSFP